MSVIDGGTNGSGLSEQVQSRPRFTIPMLLLGAAVGSAGIFAFSLGQTALTGWDASASPTLILGSVVVFGVWSAGLLPIGWPLWVAMHRLGMTGIVPAAVAGFVTPALVVAAFWILSDLQATGVTTSDSRGELLHSGTRTLHGWGEVVRDSGLMGIDGALVGLAVWLYSRRRFRST